MKTEDDIRLTIKELEQESQTWVESNYTIVVNLFRAQIKGLRYALGEDYNIRDGRITRISLMRTEDDIRKHIREIEEESKEYADYESTIRQFRAQIRGLKLALGETYSIAEGK